MPKKNTVAEIKEELLASPKKEKPRPLLSSGSTLVNLACSGKVSGAYLPGHYYLLVGGSNSGKTWLTLAALAEAANNPAFDDYQLIYDGSEGGALMSLRRFFGSKLEKRLKRVRSETVEEFYYNLDDALNAGPCIYVEDSMDGLSSEDEGNKFQENKKSFRAGKDAAGSYGDGKAKKNSSGIRQILHKLEKMASLLFIVAQTKANIGFGSQFNPHTRSGGRSLTFYAAIEIWTEIREQIKKRVKGKDRQIGILSKIHVKRTRLTGKDRTVEVPIFHSHGIDDTGSLVTYLIEEGAWTEKKGLIETKGAFPDGSVEDVVQYIEENDKEKEIRMLALETWAEIEEASRVVRKARYQ
jgi:hypothetical protein